MSNNIFMVTCSMLVLILFRSLLLWSGSFDLNSFGHKRIVHDGKIRGKYFHEDARLHSGNLGYSPQILPSTMLGAPTEELKGCKTSNSVCHPVGTVDEEKTSRTM